ncbi:MAG: ATP-binding cassette domain-containing protein [Streptosporangiales bacterium]|nr:ATP-binding cassette domain-containing protein [Streptosporangiales bacterium]
MSARSLTKSFRGIHAVRDVTVDIDDGITGLIGPNGAGKTTLFNLFTGYLRADSGRMSLEGRDLTGMSAHRVAAAGVARTFQVPRPFRDLSVRRNVATAGLLRAGGRTRAYEIADRVMDRVGLADRADRLAGELGIADLKRIELAKGLALQPRVLLLDEVFSGLTPAEMDALVPVVRQVQADGVAIVLVEHVLRVVMQLCSHVVVLDRGQVIAADSPRAIVKDPATIEAYLGVGDDEEGEDT